MAHDRARVRRRLPSGESRTVFFSQIHQVLPRLARLMVAVRVALSGSAREECSFLFAVEGRGREGMGLHHDGAADAFWLQLEGRRTVRIGPPVSPRTPLDLPDRVAQRAGSGWRTIDLAPCTLFHLPPPRTPHRVVGHGRSLAVSLTWTRARARRATALAAWDVVAGRADAIPRAARERLWVQVPVVVGPVDRERSRHRQESTLDWCGRACRGMEAGMKGGRAAESRSFGHVCRHGADSVDRLDICFV